MTPDERWLAALWPFVSVGLPPAPARVLEIGCGPLGGFVPRLRAAGYEASGVDPEAPNGPWFQQATFERAIVAVPVDVIIACTSLHHVADLPATLDLIDATLRPGGVVAVVEWARERFDNATLQWCMNRLLEPAAESGWLHELVAKWRESGESWECWCQSWAESEGLHSGADVIDGLTARFDTEHLAFGPYFFSDLPGSSDDDEQAAIDGGQIEANRIDYRGRKRGL